jgi:RNA polymerase sigma-70 factor (sigma-E family)
VDALRLAYLLSGNETLAEDVVADTFARIYPRWLRGGIENPRSYLRRAIVNEVHNRRRRRQVERREEARSKPAPALATAEDRFAERSRLVDALSALSARQRAAVVLRYYADMSEAETAVAMGITVGSVKTLTSRGLNRLRGLINEGEEGQR